MRRGAGAVVRDAGRGKEVIAHLLSPLCAPPAETHGLVGCLQLKCRPAVPGARCPSVPVEAGGRFWSALDTAGPCWKPVVSLGDVWDTGLASDVPLLPSHQLHVPSFGVHSCMGLSKILPPG